MDQSHEQNRFQKAAQDRQADALEAIAFYLGETRDITLLTAAEEQELGEAIQEAQQTLKGILLKHPATLQILVEHPPVLFNRDKVRHLKRAQSTCPSERQSAEKALDKILTPNICQYLARIIQDPSQVSSLPIAIQKTLKEPRNKKLSLKIDYALQQYERACKIFHHKNKRLVLSMARSLENKGLPLADLIQEGNIGLLLAVGKYNPNRGTKFSTYATFWIRRQMLRAIKEQIAVIRAPTYTAQYMHILTKCTLRLTAELVRPPTLEELSQASNLSPEKITRYVNHFTQPTISLDTPIGSGKESLDTRIKGDTPTANELSTDIVVNDLVGMVDKVLTPLEAKIIKRLYGLFGYEQESIGALANSTGTSPQHIKITATKALTKLRKEAENMGIKDLSDLI
jgi:RNA polymerase primary sigma factor